MISPELRHVGKVTLQKKTLRVGLTGGIASGKTLVAAIFELCGVPVAFADSMARGLMEMPGEVKEKLIDLLGADAYLPDGKLDRPALGGRLFADATLLEKVNGIVHPAVRKAALSWHESLPADTPYSIYESALLFESGAYRDFDVVVSVHAPMQMRLERACKRDGVDRDAVLARMEAQLTDKERLEKEAYVILNDGSIPLIPQVYELHKLLSQ